MSAKIKEKVHVVEGLANYEGGKVLAVFSTKRKANNYIKKLEGTNTYSSIEYFDNFKVSCFNVS